MLGRLPFFGKAAMAHLSYITACKSVLCRTRPRKRCGNYLRASCFAIPDTAKKPLEKAQAQHDNNIQILYHDSDTLSTKNGFEAEPQGECWEPRLFCIGGLLSGYVTTGYLLPIYALHFTVVLNDGGKGAQFERLRCAIWGGILGHAEQFKIYEIADGKIVHAEVGDTNGSGYGALAGFLMRR